MNQKENLQTSSNQEESLSQEKRQEFPLTSEEVADLLRESVVTVYAQVTLPNASGVPTTSIESATGFLLPGGYVVCGSATVTLPQSSGINRFPPTSETIGPVRKGRIWVQVFKVNEKGESFVYEIILIGVDGALGVALLFIDPCLKWNATLPEVPKHKGLEWGSSRNTQIGEAVYSIGFALGREFRAFNQGIIRNNRWTDVSGAIPTEHVLTNLEFNSGCVGAPLVNKFGHVIGVVDAISPGGQFGFASAQVIVEPVLNKMISGFRDGIQELDPSLVLLADPLGPYIIHIKGYLGFSWVVRYNSAFLGGTVFPSADGCSTVTDFFQEGPTFKRSVGIVVTQVDGSGLACGFTSSQAPSPFIGEITPGDLVTHITFCKHGQEVQKSLGDIVPQVAPGNITFNLLPGDEVTLHYRKQSEKYSCLHKVTRPVKQYPAEFDFVGLTSVV